MISYIHMILKHLTFMTILRNFPFVTLMTFPPAEMRNSQGEGIKGMTSSNLENMPFLDISFWKIPSSFTSHGNIHTFLTLGLNIVVQSFAWQIEVSHWSLQVIASIPHLAPGKNMRQSMDQNGTSYYIYIYIFLM